MSFIMGFILGRVTARLGKPQGPQPARRDCPHKRTTTRRNIVFCLDCKQRLGPAGQSYFNP